uniref:Uncharacterized protein MANES_06G060800 n=1 Tax=Rhizophora mucronata TaxID=61149 RepID=A0A2P2KPT4_RHIMU
MAVEPFFWYCRPVANGIWAEEMDSAFGAYTPCAIDSLVICISHLVLLGLCFYRMLLLRKSKKARKYNLRTNAYNYFLALLAGLCTAEPIIRLTRNISIFDLHGQSEQAPFEMVSLIIEAFAWGSMLLMIGLETKIYVREFRWYVRFGVVYVLVGEAAMLNIILSVRDRYSRLVGLPLSKLQVQTIKFQFLSYF